MIAYIYKAIVSMSQATPMVWSITVTHCNGGICWHKALYEDGESGGRVAKSSADISTYIDSHTDSKVSDIAIMTDVWDVSLARWSCALCMLNGSR